MSNDLKKILWGNVVALMEKRYGKPNLKRLARDAKFGTGTASRLKEQETAVGLDVVEKLARLFKIPPSLLLMRVEDKDLLTIIEAYSVDPKGREYLLLTAKGILEKHERDKSSEAESA